MAFAQKKTWGQEATIDPFNELLGGTGNLGGTMAPGGILGHDAAIPGDHTEDKADSDGEDARWGFQ